MIGHGTTGGVDTAPMPAPRECIECLLGDRRGSWERIVVTEQGRHSQAERGRMSEDLACRFLRARGARILVRNFRCRTGEIDIIAKRGKTLYFIEVKARGAGTIIDPMEAVTPRKQQSIRRTAEYYLLKNPKMEKMPCSFGVIGIDHSYCPPRIECILDAFE